MMLKEEKHDRWINTFVERKKRFLIEKFQNQNQ